MWLERLYSRDFDLPCHAVPLLTITSTSFPFKRSDLPRFIYSPCTGCALTELHDLAGGFACCCALSGRETVGSRLSPLVTLRKRLLPLDIRPWEPGKRRRRQSPLECTDGSRAELRGTWKSMNLGRSFERVGVCFFLLFILAGPSVWGQTGNVGESDAPTTSSRSDNACGLAGTVVNSETGAPIQRAAVSLAENGQTNRSALTDAAGHFEFDGLAEGAGFVSIMKPGFLDGRTLPGGVAAGVAVQIHRDAPAIVLRMLPAGAIVGRVTTRDEQPLEDFGVRVIAKRTIEGQSVTSIGQFRGQTNDDGEFRISGLPPGKYYVFVEQSQNTTLGQRGVENPREQTYAQTFYPGVSDLGNAVALELAAGRELEANFRLTAEPLYQVGGTANAQVEPVPMLQFERKAGEDFDFTESVSVENGRFQAKLLAGSYTVTSIGGDSRRLTTPGPTVVISSDTPDVHILMSAMPSIPVQVQAEHAGGSTEQGVPRQDGALAMYLQLVPRSIFRSRKYWRTDQAIESVDPGVYGVEITTLNKWRVKSVRSGGVDLLGDDLTVSEGAQPPAIEVTLRDDAASIAGTVTQGNTLVSATVLLVQQHSARNLVKTMPVITGKFDFEGVSPGEYMILALDEADEIEYRNPEILDTYLPTATHIDVLPHSVTNINLALVGR
jgi:hypothetical protein